MVIPSADDEITNQPRCLFCGEAERIEIWEIWSDHDFTLDTCCPALIWTVKPGFRLTRYLP